MAVTLHTYPDRDACLAALAQVIGQRLGAALQDSARARMLLPGGSSPQALLPLLAHQTLDWNRVDISPSDERWVPADASQSNLALLRKGLPAAQLLDPRQADTPEAAARRWGEQLCNWLPLSVVLLGVGEDGHFASLFPGMPGLAQALDPAAQPAALPGLAPVEPVTRLSANLALLIQSDWLGLLVFGEAKRELIAATMADRPATRALPLYALLHGDQWTLDIHWAP
jgi:6-phosphogluconolactonase